MNLSKLAQRFLVLSMLTMASTAMSEINVVVTTTNLKDIVKNVGKEKIKVDSISKGGQDVHYIEAKPSHMVKIAKADLVVSVGFELESAWLPLLIRGAKNPSVNPGTLGNLEIAPSIARPLEVPTKKLTRADGDIHADGNPHVLLDPRNAASVSMVIAKRLAKLDPKNEGYYLNNAKTFQTSLLTKYDDLKARIQKSGINEVVTYHKTLSYFMDAFGIKAPMVLEPKPGVPPSAKHIMNVIKHVQNNKISIILVENYFDSSVANRVAKDAKNTKVFVVPVAVKGNEKVNSLVDLYEYLVSAIEGKKYIGS